MADSYARLLKDAIGKRSLYGLARDLAALNGTQRESERRELRRLLTGEKPQPSAEKSRQLAEVLGAPQLIVQKRPRRDRLTELEARIEELSRTKPELWDVTPTGRLVEALESTDTPEVFLPAVERAIEAYRAPLRELEELAEALRESVRRRNT